MFLLAMAASFRRLFTRSWTLELHGSRATCVYIATSCPRAAAEWLSDYDALAKCYSSSSVAENDLMYNP